METSPLLLKLAAATVIAGTAGFAVGHSWISAPGHLVSAKNPLFSKGEKRTLTIVETNEDVGALMRDAVAGGARSVPRVRALVATLQPDEFAPMASVIQSVKGRAVRPALLELYRVWAHQDPQAAIASAQQVKPAVNAYTTAALASWVANDQPRAVEWVRALPNGDLRREALNTLLNVIAEKDPSAAIAMATADPNLINGNSWTQILTELTARSPRLAADAAFKVPKPSRSNAVSTVASVWAETDPQAAFAWAMQLPPDQFRSRAVQSVLSKIAQTEPEKAMAMATDSLPAGQERIDGVTSSLRIWLKADFAKGEAWVNALPAGKLRNEAYATLISVLGDTNPAEAIAKMFANPEAMKQARSVLSQLASKDPRAAVEAVLKLPEGRSRNDAIESLASSWARNEPDAAIAWLRQLPASGSRNNALRNIIYNELRDEPVKAIEVAMNDLSPGWERTSAISNTIANWSRTDPDAALQYLDKLPQGEAYNQAFSSLANRMAEDNPQKALTLVMDQPNVQARNQALSSVLQQWIKDSPKEGFQWLEAHRTDLRPDTLQSIVYGLIHENPAQALTVADWMGNGDSANNTYQTISQNWVRNDLSGAEAWIEKMPAGPKRDSFIQGFINGMAEIDPARASQYIEKLPDGNVRDNAINQLTYQWARNEPEAALEWLGNTPAGEKRNQALGNLVSSWARSDGAAASAWVKTLPSGKTRDTAIQQLAPNIVASDPKAAIAWAKAIGDESTRQSTLATTAGEWLRHDPKAATAYIESTPDFPEATKNNLLERTKKR